MATWKGGIYTGTGRIQLPEPKRMDTRKYTRKETTIDQITVRVKDITLALKTHKEPGCKASWEKRLKLETEIPLERNRQKLSTRDRNKKRHELLVQKHTT